MRYMPVHSIVSQSFRASLSTLKLPAAAREHLRHEWQPVQLAVLVERSQDVGFAAYFDDLTDAQVERLAYGRLPSLHATPLSGLPS